MVGDYPEPGSKISGGVERVIDTLLPELACEVELTLIVPGASKDMICDQHGVRTIYMRRRSVPGSLRYWTSDARRLARIVDDLRPDIVHLQGVGGIGRLVTCPRILTVHGILHKDVVTSSRNTGLRRLARRIAALLVRLVEARARRQIGHIIAINPYVLEVLPDIAANDAFAIPNPLDPVFAEPISDASMPRQRSIVSVGRIGGLKNTFAIVQAAAAAMKLDPDLVLTVCGAPVDEAYHAKCKDFIMAEGLTERIRLAGNLSSHQLKELLDKASCLVMASRQENAPMAIAEAQARGVAVVAPEAFGIRYMIEPGVNGMFWPMDDLAAQVAVLRRALEHKWDREAIARAARATYGVRDIATRTLAAYRAVLSAATSSAYGQPETI